MEWITPNDKFAVKDWPTLTAIFNGSTRLPTKEIQELERELGQLEVAVQVAKEDAEIDSGFILERIEKVKGKHQGHRHVSMLQ